MIGVIIALLLIVLLIGLEILKLKFESNIRKKYDDEEEETDVDVKKIMENLEESETEEHEIFSEETIQEFERM